MDPRKTFLRSLVLREKLQPSSNIDENEEANARRVESRTYANNVKVRFDQGITKYSTADQTKLVSKKFDDGLTGEGRIQWKDGTRYEGDIYKGLRFGKGSIECGSSGTVYKGEWYMGLKHGLGELSYASGSSYEGHFCFGMKHGKGVMRYPSGNAYMGDFHYDSKCGFGKMYWLDRRQKYKGYWSNNQHEGMGRLCWRNTLDNGKELDMAHIGLWRNGKREGYGAIYYANGDVLIGNWVADKKEGFQYYMDYYGQEKEMLFVNDKLISESKIRKVEFASDTKDTDTANQIHSRREDKTDNQDSKNTKENVTSNIKVSTGIIKKSKQQVDGPTKKVKIAEPEKIFAKDQTLEEMNIYRQIVNIDSLLKYINIRNNEKDLLFENIILTLIRHNSAIKRVFEQLAESDDDSRSSARRMRLSKLADVFDRVQDSSPFLDSDTFLRFFLENPKNRSSRVFNFRNQFKTINRLRKDKLGMTLLKIDKDFDAYLSFEFSADTRIDYECFETSFEHYKGSLRSQKEQRNSILGSQIAQFKRFSRKSRRTHIGDEKVMYFTYVDALLRAALLRVNYNTHHLEQSILRLLKYDLKCFEPRPSADQDLLISAVNTHEVISNLPKIEEHSPLDESMYEDADFRRPDPDNHLKPPEQNKMLRAFSHTEKNSDLLTQWLTEVVGSGMRWGGSRPRKMKFKQVLREFLQSIQPSAVDFERVMFSFLSEADKKTVDEAFLDQPQKISELQRSESIRNLVVENMFREKIDNFFEIHTPFFIELLNANFTIDTTLVLLKKIEVPDQMTFDLQTPNSPCRPPSKKWPKRNPLPGKSRSFLKSA
jgi:hypothetical protein